MSVHPESEAGPSGPAQGSPRARRAAVALLRWYPRPWRARYQREMQALLEEMPVGWRQVANLIATGVREWLSPRAFGWPARSAAGRILTRRNLSFAAFAYALDGVARITAAQLLAAGVTVREELEDDLAWVMSALLVRISLAWLCRRKVAMRSPFAAVIDRHVWLRHLSDWEVRLWLVAAVPGWIVKHALPTPVWMTSTLAALEPYMDVYFVWMWTSLLLMNSLRTARIRHVWLKSMKRKGLRYRDIPIEQ